MQVMTDSGKKEERSALPLSDNANLHQKNKLIWKNFTRELLSASVVFECRQAVSKEYHKMTFPDLSEIQVLGPLEKLP